MRKATGIIPARYGSLRFPGKPLTPILGITMIQRVYERAKQTDVLEKVSSHPANKIDELLPDNWKKPNSAIENDTVVKDQIVQVS